MGRRFFKRSISLSLFPTFGVFDKWTQYLHLLQGTKWLFCCFHSTTLTTAEPVTILGSFAKLRKATYSIVMSVCPHGITWLPLDWFSWNLVFEYFFENISRKYKYPLKSDKNDVYFTWAPICIFDVLISSDQLFLWWEMFQTKVAEKIKPYILCPISCRLWDKVEKLCRVTGVNIT